MNRRILERRFLAPKLSSFLQSPNPRLSSGSSSCCCRNTHNTAPQHKQRFFATSCLEQPRPSHFLDVSPLAETLRSQVRIYTQQHKVKLLGILATTNDEERIDAELYSKSISETFQEDRIEYELWRCAANAPAIQSLIHQANADNTIDGILVYYPIPKYATVNSSSAKGPYKNRLEGVYYKSHDDYFRDMVIPTKDVEGLGGTRWLSHSKHHIASVPGTLSPPPATSISTASTSLSPPIVQPCTAKSVHTILDYYHNPKTGTNSLPWLGQTVSIINRSEIMGRPLAIMLASCGATVYSIDEKTTLKFRPQGSRVQRYTDLSLEQCVAQSNVIVTGVPHEAFCISTECIAPGTTVVNVSNYLNVDEECLMDRTDIQYIPHVGKVTVAVLEQNLVRLHQLHHGMQTHDTSSL